MNDDQIERALFALPLEEPPADLHARIMAATIHRPRQIFRAWEVWVIGTLVAVMVWLAYLVFSLPQATDRLGRAIGGLVNAFGLQLGSGLALWILLGISTAVWISFISLPQSRRRATDH
jgi:hypothetical protein